MTGNVIETLVGLLVLAIAGAFLFFAYQTVDIAHGGGYTVKARFDRVDGIGIGADVRMSGIKIGTVSAMELDQKTYLAGVELSIDSDVKLPEDVARRVIYGEDQVKQLVTMDWDVINKNRTEWTRRWQREVER